jgi:hypothetical protein
MKVSVTLIIAASSFTHLCISTAQKWSVSVEICINGVEYCDPVTIEI